MREVQFLKQNADKWKNYEKIIGNSKSASPDDIADLFIELTDDLSYARTFFPESKTERYLNLLTSKFHNAIYVNRKEKKGRIIRFWKIDYPEIIKKHYRHILISITIFIVAIGLGVLSSAYDDGFVRLILGDSYVKMTMENIKKGDPMAVYKSMNEFTLFFSVTLNNVYVAFLAFIMGLFFSFGTGFILFSNGVMIGAFHYLFYKQGLLVTSLLSIWIHGTLEIFSILIAGAAGITIGNSILFPGNFSRLISFQRGARDGIKIVIGIVPFFIIAGFLEGFVTRYSKMPVALSLAIIGLSFLFIGWYFFVYPVSIKKMRYKA